MIDSGIILCVDDDTTVLVALRTLLTHAMGNDLLIEIAESGAEALELLEDLEQQGQHLSIVISDFIMPGMRGDELLIQLHHRSPKTITIMLTGQSDFDSVKKVINQANLYRFLEKPFNHDDIILTVKSAFLAYEHERTLCEQNQQLRILNNEFGVMLSKVQESERLLEQRVAQRTHELDEKNQALQLALRTLEDVERIARHDLKTPLVSIAAAPSLFRAGRTLSAQEEEILGMIENASNRAISMVNLSLDLFRMESGSYVFRPVAVDLIAIAKLVAVGLRAQAKSKFVNIQLPENAATVYVEGDESLCYSILGNLIKNAVEAAPEHTAVDITLVDDVLVQLRIHNQGTVPVALREQFFAKYSTSGKSGGTGLGTYSSHLLATVQGGSLTMQTSEIEGTSLCLSLNRSQAPQTARHSEALASPSQHVNGLIVTAPNSKYSLLLVDDDDFNQMVMAEYIPKERYTLDSAINGRMALEKVMLQRPDIIIMDLDMPIMGGIESLQGIRQYQAQYAQTPSFVIAYSGNDDAQSCATYLQSGFDACLSKPSNREEVATMLRMASLALSGLTTSSEQLDNA
ncbi:response regulator [Undibacterium sp. Di24W]|uniref:response regulator n=1 Tax=Undibacterium sp. Di24W TaxID=3413033 RepID=UPI003BF16A2D